VEQRRLPGVPELGVRAAHVGDGEHVEVVEVRLVADRARELLDHLGVEMSFFCAVTEKIR
jgi:hypothetical protein